MHRANLNIQRYIQDSAKFAIPNQATIESHLSSAKGSVPSVQRNQLASIEAINQTHVTNRITLLARDLSCYICLRAIVPLAV